MVKKFRAWNTRYENWHRTELDFYGFHIFGEVTLVSPPRISDLEYLIEEQYIGFNDIKDTDIYEGDIVIDNYNEKPYTIEMPDIYYMIECGDVDTSTMKIIGNIHQTYKGNMEEWDYNSPLADFNLSTEKTQNDWNQTLVTKLNSMSKNNGSEVIILNVPAYLSDLIESLLLFDRTTLMIGDKYKVEYIDTEDEIIYVGYSRLKILNYYY